MRAFLDYYGFSYEVVEVNPVTRKQINFSIDYKKVPIVRVNNDKNFTESSLIISEVGKFYFLIFVYLGKNTFFLAGYLYKSSRSNFGSN